MTGGVSGRVLIVATVLLLVAAGLCLLDGDQTTSADLCLVLGVPSLGLLFTSELALIGRLAPAPVATARRHISDRPTPPPRA